VVKLGTGVCREVHPRHEARQGGAGWCGRRRLASAGRRTEEDQVGGAPVPGPEAAQKNLDGETFHGAGFQLCCQEGDYIQAMVTAVVSQEEIASSAVQSAPRASS